MPAQNMKGKFNLYMIPSCLLSLKSRPQYSYSLPLSRFDLDRFSSQLFNALYSTVVYYHTCHLLPTARSKYCSKSSKQC